MQDLLPEIPGISKIILFGKWKFTLMSFEKGRGDK